MKVELCPQCGSGKVSRTNPLADTVKCDGCRWAGKERELMTTEVAQDSMAVALAVAQNFLIALTQESAIPIGRAMFKAGLVQSGTDSVVIGRLVRSAVTAACRATLEEVDHIQEEMVHGTSDTRSS